MSSEKTIETDVLVIGGGIAGCFAAIKAREQGLKVTLVDKTFAGKSGAGISAPAGWMVHNPEWGADFNEVMAALDRDGEYLNHRDWCEIILKESLDVYNELVAYGVDFPPNIAETAHLFMPPYGNVPPGFRNVPPVLGKQAKKAGADIMNRIMITDLLKQDGSIVGAMGFSLVEGDLYIFKSKATVLAGGSNSFKPNGMPVSMLTGDAEAMAYRAGAEITGKEFCGTLHATHAQYPAALFAVKHVGPPPFIGQMKDGLGEPVNLPRTSEPDLSLEFLVHAGRTPIYANTDNPHTKEHVSHVFGEVADKYGEVRLAGGSASGYNNVGTNGVWVVDTNCATSLPGLYVAGDCGGTRHNGAFILNVGNGTAPSAVTGRRAGTAAANYASGTKQPKTDKAQIAAFKKKIYEPLERKNGYDPRWVTQLLQNTMTPYFVINIKHGDRMQAALTTVGFLRDHLAPQMYAADAHEMKLAHETKNMILAAEMILRASLERKESRGGAHYREDYPRRDDAAWLAWTQVKEEQGEMKVSKVPVPKEWHPDFSKPYAERYPFRFPGEEIE